MGKLLLIMSRTMSVLLAILNIITYFSYIADAHLAPLEIPAYNGERCNKPLNNRTNKQDYKFIPGSTIAGFVFVSVWFGFIVIAKIMGSSSDKYKINNKFDLVIFKPATKDSLIGPRRIHSNNNIYIHNINAATACGFDLSALEVKSYDQLFNLNTNDSISPLNSANSINNKNSQH